MQPKTVMRKRAKQPEGGGDPNAAADAEVAGFALLAMAPGQPVVPALMAPVPWQQRAPLLAVAGGEVDTPPVDDADLQGWPSAAAYLASNPLERNGARRRAPLSERFVPYNGSRMHNLMGMFGPILGEGVNSVALSITLRNRQPCVMRSSKIYEARDSLHFRREVAKHVLLERLREQYPQLMRNVVQLIDYQLLTHLPLGSLYAQSSPPWPAPIDPDINATVPRLVTLFEPAGRTLSDYIHQVVATQGAAEQLAFFASVLAQLLCQLAYLHQMLPRFNHNDLHLKNLMLQDVAASGVGAVDTLQYEVQLGPGVASATGELAPRLSLNVPLSHTHNHLLKIIDMDLAYLEYLPTDQAGTPGAEALPPARMTAAMVERQHNTDAIRAVTVLIMVFEEAMDAKGTRATSNFALSELHALLGRMYSSYRQTYREDLEFALAQILLRDRMFRGFARGTALAPPVVGSRQVDRGHVRVERIRSELAALNK